MGCEKKGGFTAIYGYGKGLTVRRGATSEWISSTTLILAIIMATKIDSKSTLPLVSRIEADLLAGHFRPGEWLKQADIEASYAANRFDVRMALLDLKARCLVEQIPNRGFRVVNLSEREREDLVETRIILETAAARLAAERIPTETIDELAEIVGEFEVQIPIADLNVLRALNGRFHDLLYQSSGNELLASEIKALRERGLPGLRGGALTWRTMAGISQSNEDHVAMITLLRARDGDGLAEVIRNHLSIWRSHLPSS
ncbi:MAG: GntR family transcriptional regulator [Qipengyuania sp.]|nr:GntR family transcriptional regulator [Qipengyuania sp.]